LVVAGLVVTIEDVRRMAWVIAAGGALTVILSRVFGTSWGGRLTLAFGSISNPNDYATHLILTLPFLLMYALSGRQTALRVGAGLMAFISVVVIVQTGSRGGLLALAALFVFGFVKANAQQRMAMSALLVAGGFIGAMLLPDELRARYASTFGSPQPTTKANRDLLLEAEGSKQARTELFKSGVRLTLMNPVFGVGPGQFMVGENDLAEAAGKPRGHWQVTHNSYIEVSSETGFPGLFLFVGAMVSAILVLNRTFRRTRRDPRLRSVADIAFCMMVSMAGFAVCMLFASMAYKYYLPSIIGLAVPFAAAAQREIWLCEKSAGPVKA
jgi:O-antigen ligase